jgi:hypothetical protein
MKRTKARQYRRNGPSRLPGAASSFAPGLPVPDWRELATGLFMVTAMLAPQIAGADLNAQAVQTGTVEAISSFYIILVALFAVYSTAAANPVYALCGFVAGCLAYVVSVSSILIDLGSPTIAAQVLWLLWTRARPTADTPAWTQKHYHSVVTVCTASWVSLVLFLILAFVLSALFSIGPEPGSHSRTLTNGAAAFAWACYFLVQSILTPYARSLAMRDARTDPRGGPRARKKSA